MWIIDGGLVKITEKAIVVDKKRFKITEKNMIRYIVPYIIPGYVGTQVYNTARKNGWTTLQLALKNKGVQEYYDVNNGLAYGPDGLTVKLDHGTLKI